MKVAIITDTHYGARKGSKYLHDYFEKFYDDVAQHLKAWQPSPPKPKKTDHDDEHLEGGD